ncbi:MAG: hypothetical protein NZZ41_06850 [Candidatus Dojkabacteria bacterium]|nr:hypothetical protein [Candidatus Dojkabacteria bacterium]
MISNVVYDLDVEYTVVPKTDYFSFFNPFTICIYDDVHYMIDGTTVNLSDLFIVNDDNIQLWEIDNEKMNYIFSISGFNIWYINRIDANTIGLKISEGLGLNKTGSYMFRSKSNSSYGNYLEKFTVSTFNSVLSLSAPAPMSIFFVRKNDFALRYSEIISKIFETAYEMNKSFYVDSGIGFLTPVYVQAQIDAFSSLYNNQQYMFGAFNMPFMTKPTQPPPITLPNVMNMFVTAGYSVISSRIAETKAANAYLTGDTNTISAGNTIISVFPASCLYYLYLLNMYDSDDVYIPVINKILMNISSGVDYMYKYDQITKDWNRNYKINPMYFSDSTMTLRFFENLTPYVSTSYSPLKEEHWARFAIDLARYVSFIFKYLIGIRSDNEKEIENMIEFVTDEIYKNVLDKAKLKKESLVMKYEVDNKKGKVYFDFYLRLPPTIKEIYLITVAVPNKN